MDRQKSLFFSKQQPFKNSLKHQGHAAGLETLHDTRERGGGQTEKITDSRCDLAQQYCRDEDVIKVQTDRATTEGKEK